MMIIPSSFNMLGQTIVVKYDNKYCAENECFGRFISYDNVIIIASKYKAEKGWRKYKQSIVESTFCHELAHCILYHSGNPDWMNEQLVESIAGLLHQYLTTNK
tara:strand:- start:810 stop:1118 length:309 start_codon:yes stop_codon:yes gene_type:complete